MRLFRGKGSARPGATAPKIAGGNHVIQDAIDDAPVRKTRRSGSRARADAPVSVDGEVHTDFPSEVPISVQAVLVTEPVAPEILAHDALWLLSNVAALNEG